MRKALVIFSIFSLCILMWYSTDAQDLRPVRDAIKMNLSDVQSSMGYSQIVCGDSTEEDTANPYWDGIDDSIITRYGQPFYVGNTLAMDGQVSLALVTWDVGNDNVGDPSEGPDSLVLRGKVQYGLQGDGAPYIDWFDSCDVTLFDFTDTLTGASTLIDNVWREYKIVKPTAHYTNSAKVLNANVVRFVSEWPDSDYVSTYLTIDSSGSSSATKFYAENAININLQIIWTKMDSIR